MKTDIELSGSRRTIFGMLAGVLLAGTVVIAPVTARVASAAGVAELGNKVVDKSTAAPGDTLIYSTNYSCPSTGQGDTCERATFSDPLPNLLFTRDSSVWVSDRATVTALAMPARRRETQLTELIYQFHPRFVGTQRIHGWDKELLEGGDVLALAEGVLAVGVGERTRPAGAERLARTAFAEGLAHTVLAVPIDQDRATMHLDTICTMVDVDAMVMYPNVAHRLAAITMKPGDDGDVVIEPIEPFLDAAARAMGIERLRLIDTGLDPVTAEREQWDDGNNTLAIEPRVAIAYERNVETNERLVAAGIEVIPISGSELGSGRGGPRCMSCPISRDPL